MEILKVTWQNFANGNGFNEMDHRTYINLEQAILKLEPLLLNFGVKLCFEKQYFPSNNGMGERVYQILIDNEPLEKLVELEYEYGFIEDEGIPEHLIVTAVLMKLKDKTLRVVY